MPLPYTMCTLLLESIAFGIVKILKYLFLTMYDLILSLREFAYI